MTSPVLYVAPNLGAITTIVNPRLLETTERHKVPLEVGALTTCLAPLAELDERRDLAGVVVAMERGWPGSSHLRFVRRVLSRGRRAWFYWPNEQVVECLDAESIRGYWVMWALGTSHRIKRRLFGVAGPVDAEQVYEVAQSCEEALRTLASRVQPVPVANVDTSGAGPRVRGAGIYFRADYWVKLTSGGSYGHTCYVAKELAARTDRLVCLMASRYPLLDDMGVEQTVLEVPAAASSETALLGGTARYEPLLELSCRLLRPAFIYERLCLGNFAGASVSQRLGIPYIVEYNGSEISMSRSFAGASLQYEDLFVRAEDVAFRQATIITVVSDVVRDSLVARGVDPVKILVNPNGADPCVYAPAAPEERRTIRAENGFAEGDRVIGFTGTFGGWHGIDVLAAAIPRICAEEPSAEFLLIGDGTHKAMVDQAVAQHHLERRVRSVGRVPQEAGARLLKACDLFVSPHNSHMVDSKFFGSPTKLFEYMAAGGGIVASDLEQLGEVLSPALRPAAFAGTEVSVTNERAVLCTPGDVDQFVTAVVGLVRRPDVAARLGRNARQAVLDQYSWQQHVSRTLAFAQSAPASSGAVRERKATGDAFKEEVQNQWNENPVGTQYARKTKPYTLDWFKEIEEYRYGVYAPWMPEVMEFREHAGHDVLEIGGGVGTDLSQFARHGARVTDLDLSAGHLAHAQQNFSLRGLDGRFVHHDAESLPFESNSFDVVYSNGVLHHTPNTTAVVDEIFRVLRPGGRAIVMMYAEHSLHYWWFLVETLGFRRGLLQYWSVGELMSRKVEVTQTGARPLVKVYSARRLRRMFQRFDDRHVFKRQLVASELPALLRWMPVAAAERLMGWNVIIKARKPLPAR